MNLPAVQETGDSNSKPAVLWQLRGVGGGREVPAGAGMIHVDEWQKTTQQCKAIILQLKIIKKKIGAGPLWDGVRSGEWLTQEENIRVFLTQGTLQTPIA